jgi:hypothetical protein
MFAICATFSGTKIVRVIAANPPHSAVSLYCAASTAAKREVALIVALNLPPRRISLPHDADGCAHHGTSLRISHIPRESRRRQCNPRGQPAEREQCQDSVE